MKMLEWNVYVGNFNAKKIETHNVFHHTRFTEDCRAAAKKFKDDKDAFAEEVRQIEELRQEIAEKDQTINELGEEIIMLQEEREAFG